MDFVRIVYSVDGAFEMGRNATDSPKIAARLGRILCCGNGPQISANLPSSLKLNLTCYTGYGTMLQHCRISNLQ